jgi:hypothetical protein
MPGLGPESGLIKIADSDDNEIAVMLSSEPGWDSGVIDTVAELMRL